MITATTETRRFIFDTDDELVVIHSMLMMGYYFSSDRTDYALSSRPSSDTKNEMRFLMRIFVTVHSEEEITLEFR